MQMFESLDHDRWLFSGRAASASCNAETNFTILRQFEFQVAFNLILFI